MPYKVKDIGLVTEHLKFEEGCELERYEDSEGYATIGIGHLLEDEQSDEELEIIGSEDVQSITMEQAEKLFELDTEDVLEDMPRLFTEEEWDSFDAVRQCVIISQLFQCGCPRLRKFKKMITAIKEGDWETAAKESLDSRAAKQTPQRWERQADMLQYGADGKTEDVEDDYEDDYEDDPCDISLASINSKLDKILELLS